MEDTLHTSEQDSAELRTEHGANQVSSCRMGELAKLRDRISWELTLQQGKPSEVGRMPFLEAEKATEHKCVWTDHMKRHVLEIASAHLPVMVRAFYPDRLVLS